MNANDTKAAAEARGKQMEDVSKVNFTIKRSDGDAIKISE